MNFKFLAVIAWCLTMVSCSNNDSELETTESYVEDADMKFISDVHQFSNDVTELLLKMAEKSNNYNSYSTRSMHLDEEIMNNYVSDLANSTQTFLIENGIEMNDLDSLDEGRMAYVGLMLVDYDKIQNATRASVGDCVLRGAGLGELVGGKVMSRRTVMKMFIKAGLKRAVPYVGWGLFASETAACLMGY